MTLLSCASCRRAGRPHEKPPAEFHRNSQEPTGYRASCKACEGERRRQRGARARQSMREAVDEFEIVWDEPETVPLPEMAPLPPPVQRSWEPSSGLDTSGPGLPRKGCKRVLALGDIHFPFHSHRGLRLVLEMLDSERYDVIIQMGDLYDLLAASKYSRSLNLMTPRDETDEARRWAVWFWAEVRKRQPRARLIQIRGNHDTRGDKRVLEALPAIEHLAEPTIRQLFTFEGVELVWDSRQEVEIDGVLYLHGHKSFGQHFLYNQQNTVAAHLHRGAVLHRQVLGGTIWELNCGWLGDHVAPSFGYVPQKRVHGSTLGVGAVDEYGPRFIPF